MPNTQEEEPEIVRCLEKPAPSVKRSIAQVVREKKKQTSKTIKW